MALTITASEWKRYRDRLSKISKTAADLMQKYAQSHGFKMDQEMIDYAYSISTKYGEASAELACEMYDELAEYWKAGVPVASPAPTASYAEVARAMNGSVKQSPTGALISSVAERLVKQAGADTTAKNAIRDGAYWAWIPGGGETCAFCMTLASRGWQKASKNMLKNGHAEHIHQNCDCTFAVSFDGMGSKEYPFYNPQMYKQIYNGSSNSNDPQKKINAMRRSIYEKNKDKINAQKRDAYAARNLEKESSGK